MSVEAAAFRRALGHFCTGVTVVAAMSEGEPVGFACQSFAALSLDPPLVLFCPAKTAHTWPLIERSGAFCVNILAHHQRDVSAVFGRAGSDKFAEVEWSAAPSGSPVLTGVLTWIRARRRRRRPLDRRRPRQDTRRARRPAAAAVLPRRVHRDRARRTDAGDPRQPDHLVA